MNNNIYFPLRSNLSFFEQKTNQPYLVLRIKQSILMYENIIFESGGYILTHNNRSAIDLNIPPDQIGKEMFKIPEEQSGKYGVYIKDDKTGKQIDIIKPGPKNKMFTVSFQNFLNNIGIQDEDFIQLKWIELSQDGKNKINELVNLNEKFMNYIPGDSVFKKYILRNFYHSIILSNYLNTPMMIDNLHDNLLKNIMSNTIKISDNRIQILKRIFDLLEINIPDFSTMEINEILTLRKDKLFIKFRNKLLEINNYLTQNEISKFNESEIDKLFIRELLQEINEITPKRKKIVVKAFLGCTSLIPTVGSIPTMISLVKDIDEYNKFNNNWLAFIFKYKS